MSGLIGAEMQMPGCIGAAAVSKALHSDESQLIIWKYLVRSIIPFGPKGPGHTGAEGPSGPRRKFRYSIKASKYTETYAVVLLRDFTIIIGVLQHFKAILKSHRCNNLCDLSSLYRFTQTNALKAIRKAAELNVSFPTFFFFFKFEINVLSAMLSHIKSTLLLFNRIICVDGSTFFKE